MKKIQPKHLAHIVMISFAVASLFNIQAFFNTLEDNIYLAWSLAVALAAVLVVMAALLSEIKWNMCDGKLLTVLTVTVGLTVVSGSIQGAAYALHAGWAGWLLGFALPGLGELGLALAISAYTRSLDGREVAEAQRELATGVRRHLVDAIANVDKSLIEAQVNRAVGKVTKELVDSVVVDMIAELRGNRVQQIVQLDAPTVQQVEPDNTSNTPNLAILNTQPVQIPVQQSALERANEQRKQAKLEAQQVVLNAYRSNPDASLRDVAELVNRSPQTISNWLKDLEAQNIVHVNGSVKVYGELRGQA